MSRSACCPFYPKRNWYQRVNIFTFFLFVANCDGISALASSMSHANNDGGRMIQCTECQESFFTSRNILFQHLKEEHGYERDFHSTAEERTAASVAARSSYYNPHHDAYYRRQCHAGVMSVSEWEEAYSYFRRPLGVSFRLSSSAKGARARALKNLKDSAGNDLSVSSHLPSCFIATRPLREWPVQAQQGLVDAQDVGVANRQELCSMVPPLLLLPNNRRQSKNAKHATVLDLCAAPGSKTLQLMDLLNGRSSEDNETGFQGLLVANDGNRQRLLTVARRARIAGDYSKASLIINASDGRYFPALRKWAGYKLKFDYVLADVPCSGDGTLRKLPKKDWERWNVKHHLTLHKLQVRLLQRSLQLVKKGGRVVYSTCSLDPIENEAVVAAAITNLGGPSVYRIVAPPEKLDENDVDSVFPYTPGSENWIVPHPCFDATREPTVYHTFDDVPAKLRRKDIQASMFPPASADMRHDIKNCCRILPQHLDSGGFFCAVIERIPAKYFAICCPNERYASTKEQNADRSYHHGRIYLLSDEEIEHDGVGLTATKRLRLLLRVERQTRLEAGVELENLEYYFEGLPTIETAQKWLHQHGGFVEGRSDTVSEFPGFCESPHVETDSKQWYKQNEKNRESRTAIYSPLISSPHPDLIDEFIAFFGMHSDLDEARMADVIRFPREKLVAAGGGEKALKLTTNSLESYQNAQQGSPKMKSKYLRLALVSDEIRTLFTGGAKFNPIELGLVLCWVPLSCGHSLTFMETEDPVSKLKSTRYGLTDEAAEIIGRCATKRILPLTIDIARQLLTSGALDGSNGELSELVGVSAGAIIAVVQENDSPLFLSCCFDTETRVLRLLTDKRMSSAWLRLIFNSKATTIG